MELLKHFSHFTSQKCVEGKFTNPWARSLTLKQNGKISYLFLKYLLAYQKQNDSFIPLGCQELFES